MRMRGPDNNHVGLTVDSPVVTEPTVPCQKADIFPAANRLSDFFILHCPASRFNLFMALQLSPYASVWKEINTLIPSKAPYRAFHPAIPVEFQQIPFIRR